MAASERLRHASSVLVVHALRGQRAVRPRCTRLERKEKREGRGALAAWEEEEACGEMAKDGRNGGGVGRGSAHCVKCSTAKKARAFSRRTSGGLLFLAEALLRRDVNKPGSRRGSLRYQRAERFPVLPRGNLNFAAVSGEILLIRSARSINSPYFSVSLKEHVLIDEHCIDQWIDPE